MPDQDLDDQAIGGSALHIALKMRIFDACDLLIKEMREKNLKIAGDDDSHSALDLGEFLVLAWG